MPPRRDAPTVGRRSRRDPQAIPPSSVMSFSRSSSSDSLRVRFLGIAPGWIAHFLQVLLHLRRDAREFIDYLVWNPPEMNVAELERLRVQLRVVHRDGQ